MVISLRGDDAGHCRGSRRARKDGVGVPLTAIHVVNIVGAVPIAVTRTDTKRDCVLPTGTGHVIGSETQDLLAKVMRITEQRGARMAFEPLSNPGVVTLAVTLAPQGTLMIYGSLSGRANQTPFLQRPAVGKSVSLRGYLVLEVIHSPECSARARAFIENGLRDRSLKPTIDRTFRLGEIVEAHRYLANSQQLGKIVVVP